MKKFFKAKWLFALFIVGGAVWYFYPHSSEASIEYQTGPLSTGNVESVVNTAGTLNPLSTVEVGSEVSGLIVELNVDFNSVVTAGELLARIDDRDVKMLLRQREADLEVAKANLVQEKAAMLQAETDNEFAQNQYQRAKSLLERKLISEADLETAFSKVRSANSSLENAKAKIVSAQASILQREAQLEQAQIDLERTQIRSPVDGIVINRLVDLGQAVKSSQTIPTLFQVAQDLAEMQIEADVGEADIGKISEGLAVRFSVDAYSGQEFEGTVTQVRKSAGSANNVVTYTIIIDAANPRKILLPGMTANVNIVLGSKQGVLRAPNAALRFRPPGTETAATAGAGAGAAAVDNTARFEQMGKEIGLTGDKQKQFVAALQRNQTEARAVIQAAQAATAGGPGGGGGPGGFDRTAITNLTAKLANEIKLMLSEEQFAAYQTLSAAAGGGRGAGTGGGRATAADGLTGRGTIYVLRNGLPVAINVRTGLVDSQNTEIQSDELKTGDEVIVRAVVLEK